jgi:3-oxoacyl-[acyl-carrier protein] reductase
MSEKSIALFGAGSGIGGIIAGHYLGMSAKMTLSARDPGKLRFSGGSGVNIVPADVTDQKSVRAVFESHQKKFGAPPSGVINCAAVQGPLGPFWDLPTDELDAAVRTNVTGAFYVAAEAVRAMRADGKGSIVLFSGGGAVHARANFSAYGSAKTAVLRFVETAAEELSAAGLRDIVINAIAPGAVKTRMTDEILRAGDRAGGEALAEAEEVFRTGGTPPELILKLVDFLLDTARSRSISGRLVHVRENYENFVARADRSAKTEAGLLRRLSLE